MDDETKAVVKEETAQEPLTEIDAEKEYTLFNFVKENGSVLFGCGTACVTVLAGGMRLASYLYHLAYWRYWNIDPALVSSPENYWLENIALSFLLSISVLMVQFAINPIIKSMILNRILVKRIKIDHSETHKYINEKDEVVKQFKKEKKEKEQFQKKTLATVYDDEIAMLDNYITESSTELKNDKREQKRLSIKIWALNIQVFFRHLLLVLCRMMFLFLVIFLSYLRNMLFLKAMITSVIYIAVLLVIFYYVEKSKAKKRVSKLSDEDIKEDINKIFDNLQSVSIIRMIENREIISNRTIRSLTTSVLAAFLVFLPSNYFYGFSDAKEKHIFMIAELGEKKYAVVASDSDYLITERVVITDQTAEIYVDEKKVFAKEDDPVIETVEFASSPTIQRGTAP